MGIIVGWDDDNQSIIWMEFVGKWSWYDFSCANREAASMMRSVGHRVDIVADFRQAGSTPVNNDNQALRDAVELMSHNHGMTVFLGVDRFTELMISIMQSYIPRMKTKIQMANTLDDAGNLIFSSRNEDYALQ